MLTYEVIKQIQWNSKQDANDISLTHSIVAAACAGMVSWAVIYPVDSIRSRLMSDLNRVTYIDFYQCSMTIFGEGGIRAFYRGLSYTLIRAAPVATTVLPMYDWVTSKLEDDEFS